MSDSSSHDAGRAGRKPSRRSDTTRERILTAAAQSLSRKGYSESRLSDIAVAAGLRPPAVYYYFDSRDELITEVLRVGQQRVREYVERRLDELPASASSIDRVCAAAEAHLRVELELSEFASAVTRNAGHVPPSVHEELQRESNAYHALWRTLLTAASADGSLRPDLDPSLARMFVIGALNWATEWWTGSGSFTDLVRTAQSMIRNALCAPGGTEQRPR